MWKPRSVMSITCNNARGFSSIFDAIRERRVELSRVDASEALATAEEPTAPTEREAQSRECNVTNIWKQYSIIRSKPKGYRDLWQLRYLGLRTLQILPITSAHDLFRIAEVLAYAKYRNVVLLQAMNEAMFWHCKLGKCKLSHLTSFLRSCSRLKFIPSYRYLEVFLGELDNPHHKPTIGDYLRILQFLVESDLTEGSTFHDLYERCYNHTISNMGRMNHQHLASFSHTHVMIDKTNGDIFDRICHNFERDLKESQTDHFFMLFNSLLRSDINDLPYSSSRIVGHYLECPEKWTPKLVNTVLGVLKKYYYRDTVILSKLGGIVLSNLQSFNHDEASVTMNHYSALSYKHKELIHGVMKSSLLETKDISKKLQVISALANMLAKVEYKHLGVLHKVTESTVMALKGLHNDGQAYLESHYSGDNTNIDILSIPWLVPVSQGRGKSTTKGCNIKGHKPMVITGKMVLDAIGPVPTCSQNIEQKRLPSVRRLIYKTHPTQSNEQSPVTDLSKLKVVPVSVDVIRRQNLKECLNNFYSDHFDGRHPAERRLAIRRMMNKQSCYLKLRNSFDHSKVMPEVHVEKHNRLRLNKSVRKVKQKIRYSGSHHVQSTQYYINECRVLKRCFLRPYKNILRNNPTGSHVSVCSINEDIRQQVLASTWKELSHQHVSGAYMSYHSMLTDGVTDYTVKKRDDEELNAISPLDASKEEGAINLSKEDTTLTVAKKAYLRSKFLQHMDNYIDESSPAYVDNCLLFPPLQLPSLFSRRLKKRLMALKLSHANNEMEETASYKMTHGMWAMHHPLGNITTTREHPLWRHVMDIVSSLHRLNFTSFELLDQVTNSLDLAAPMALELNNMEIQGTFVAVYKVAKRLDYMVSSIYAIMYRDSSRILANRLLGTICSSNLFSFMEKAIIMDSGATLATEDLRSFFRMVNRLIFLKYKRHLFTPGNQGNRTINAGEYHNISRTLESLKAISLLNIKEKGRSTAVQSKSTIHDLIELLDEILYSEWIPSMLQPNLVAANTGECGRGGYHQQECVEGVVNALIQRMKDGINRETALYGICAIRRWMILNKNNDLDTLRTDSKSCFSPLEHTYEIPGRSTLHKILPLLLERYNITQEAIDAAMCVPLHRKKASSSAHGDAIIHVVPGRMASRPAASEGIMHSFYFNHYYVV